MIDQSKNIQQHEQVANAKFQLNTATVDYCEAVLTQTQE